MGYPVMGSSRTQQQIANELNDKEIEIQIADSGPAFPTFDIPGGQVGMVNISEMLGKAAIMGALSLYLDFINMFMFLLQFMGNRE